ncbi:MAG: hypothetical protein J07HX64_01658 [halophilic archaeon J07HX64]|nr:MAG: hypothetical protein J07HX64_01658 [halophilic archaeon J07HX64]
MPCEIADRTAVEYVTDRQRNPLRLDPECEPAIPGYGDANARFRAIGARPGSTVVGKLGFRLPVDPGRTSCSTRSSAVVW